MAAPESRVMIGLATAGLVFAIHNKTMPANVDMRVSEAGDQILETGRKQSLWLSLGAVSAIYLVTKDAIPFMMGGAMAVSLDWLNRANIYASGSENAVVNPFSVPFQQRESEAAAQQDSSAAAYAVA